MASTLPCMHRHNARTEAEIANCLAVVGKLPFFQQLPQDRAAALTSVLEYSSLPAGRLGAWSPPCFRSVGMTCSSVQQGVCTSDSPPCTLHLVTALARPQDNPNINLRPPFFQRPTPNPQPCLVLPLCPPFLAAVCQQGTVGTTFYIVLSGTAGVYVHTTPDTSKVVRRLTAVQGDPNVGSLVAKIGAGKGKGKENAATSVEVFTVNRG
jgi:hypothetical protein